MIRKKKLEEINIILKTNEKITSTLDAISQTMLVIADSIKENEKINAKMINDINKLSLRMKTIENKIDKVVNKNA